MTMKVNWVKSQIVWRQPRNSEGESMGLLLVCLFAWYVCMYVRMYVLCRLGGRARAESWWRVMKLLDG